MKPELERLHKDLLQAWKSDPFAAIPDLERVCVASPFVAGYFQRQRGVAQALVGSGDLARAYSGSELAGRARQVAQEAATEESLMRGLRCLRRREMVRIVWRDITASATLRETLRDLSDLADGCVDAALDWCYRQACGRYGQPLSADGEVQRMVVLGMGKLGGRELNFSSDIDLIFAYPREGMTDGDKAVENSRFFLRLGQHLIRVLNDTTADGLVFRVDVRLRPFGEAGPLAASFDAMEAYYQRHGRDWERYALIKARVVAGDLDEGAALLERLRPFVYRKYLDYGAYEALRKMKALIDAEMHRRGMTENIKLGPGGIREIEFIAQTFQLIRGGRDTVLQTRSTIRALELLEDRALLPAEAVRLLRLAYEFLRYAENRLQMMADQQIHVLPNEVSQRERLAFAMGYRDWDAFSVDLERHRSGVQEQFERVFSASRPEGVEAGGKDTASEPLGRLWLGLMDDAGAATVLADLGFSDPAAAYTRLRGLRESRFYQMSSEMARQRLDHFMPLLLAATGGCENPDTVLGRVLPLIESIARRSVYVSMLAESPEARAQLVRLVAASPWIARYITRFPILLDELLDPRALYADEDKASLVVALEDELAQIDRNDREAQMDRLRHFKHAAVLRVAAADVVGALPLMRVSDRLTWIAEVVLEAVMRICWREMIARYGTPCYELDGERHEAGFAVIGYGKLGGIELGYGSDLDIVFVHDSQGGRQQTDGGRTLDNAVFFARLGQRIINMLTTMTAAGVLYEVDARLRPSGSSGLLVSGVRAFGDYQRNKAWTWEHQALVRARPVAGNEDIGELFRGIRQAVLCRQRDLRELRREVREMRQRMWESHGSGSGGRFNVKRDPGGIVDIEFMVQYLVLANAHDHPSLTTWTDNIRILDSLSGAGLLPSETARTLQDIFRLYRDRVHELSLQEQGAEVAPAEYGEQREFVRRQWRELIGD